MDLAVLLHKVVVGGRGPLMIGTKIKVTAKEFIGCKLCSSSRYRVGVIIGVLKKRLENGRGLSRKAALGYCITYQHGGGLAKRVIPRACHNVGAGLTRKRPEITHHTELLKGGV